MKKQVMVRAWELAKQGAKKFGGKAVDFFRSALTIAWKEIKNGVIVTLRNDRASQLVKSLNITLTLAERLVEVEKAFQEYNGMSAENQLKFNVWRGCRVYITCPWWSKYQNSKGNYVDMETLELHARYVRA